MGSGGGHSARREHGLRPLGRMLRRGEGRRQGAIVGINGEDRKCPAPPLDLPPEGDRAFEAQMKKLSLRSTNRATARRIASKSTQPAAAGSGTGSALARVEDALRTAGSTTTGGSSWTCPAHDDSTPSLSVRQGDLGAVLKCHAGCDTADVVKALDLRTADLFDAPRDGAAAGSTPERNKRSRAGEPPSRGFVPVEILGDLTPAQIQWLKRDRRLRDEGTLEERSDPPSPISRSRAHWLLGHRRHVDVLGRGRGRRAAA